MFDKLRSLCISVDNSPAVDLDILVENDEINLLLLSTILVTVNSFSPLTNINYEKFKIQ